MDSRVSCSNLVVNSVIVSLICAKSWVSISNGWI